MIGDSVFNALLVALALLLVHMIRGIIQSYRSKGDSAQDALYAALQKDFEALQRDFKEQAQELTQMKVNIAQLQVKIAQLETGH